MCNYRRTVLLIISLLSICYSYAYDFVVDGIYYNILSENNVEVTYKALWSVENSIYKGNIVIPDKTTFNDISYNVTSIGDSAFYFSNITSITLPITITSIGNHSFQDCKSLNSVILPNSVTSIGVASFGGCSIKTIELSKSLTSIGEGAFGFCIYLKKITIPESVTSLPNSAFEYCQELYSVQLQNNLDSIGDFCFDHCRICDLDLPKSIKYIGVGAFFANVLSKVICQSKDVPSSPETPFLNSTYENATLFVPKSSLNKYKEAEYWCKFKTIEAITGEYDDEDNTPSNSLIIGKWMLITDNSSVHTHVEFKSDGTFSYTSENNADYEEHGAYKLEDNWLYQKFSDEDDWGKSQILLINPMSLTLQDYEGEKTSGAPYSYINVNPAAATKPNSNYIGKWKHTTDDGSIHTHLELKEDGTFAYTSDNDPSYKEDGTYRVEDNILYQMFSDEDDWCLNLILLSNPMSLTMQEYNGVEVKGKPCGYIKENPAAPTAINTLIIGKWELTSNNSNVHTHVEFKEDGTFSYTSTNDATYEEHGTFRVEDNILYQMFSDENDWCLSKITVLNETSLSVVELKNDGITTSENEDSYKKIEGSGINTILRSEGGGKMFTISGREISTPTKGINIIKQKDGVIKKVVVK